MIEREFNFILEAWRFCYENGIPNWRERVVRKDWTTWRLTVPPGMIRKSNVETPAQ